METSEAVVRGPRAGEAANEEFVDSPPDAPVPQPQSGWDPYEVWRTRVKDAPEPSTRNSRRA